MLQQDVQMIFFSFSCLSSEEIVEKIHKQKISNAHIIYAHNIGELHCREFPCGILLTVCSYN